MALYRVGRFISMPRVCSPTVTTAELGFPGAAAMAELLRRQIRILPDVDGGPSVFLGEDFVRSVSLPFAGDWLSTLPSVFGP